MANRQSKSVVLVGGTDRRELVRTALTNLGGEFTQGVQRAQRPFLHPNMVNYHRREACTDVETIRGVVDHFSLLREDQVLIGDAGYHDTKKAWKKLGYDSLLRSGNLRFLDLNDDGTVESFAYTSSWGKRPIGFSATVAKSDFNVVVVPAKMHAYCIVSLSIKTHTIGSQVVKRSPFGIYGRWPWNHTGYPQVHRTMADVYAQHPADLVIIDGTKVMVGNGPTDGEMVECQWLIATFNPVAGDALAAYLMGYDPREIGYLVHLDQGGFGPIEVEKMRVEGEDPRSLRKKLKRPSTWEEIRKWR